MIHKVSIAPMIDITYEHFRVFFRMITRHCVLYTEMIHENAILNAKQQPSPVLEYSPIEHPVVIQIGGNDPRRLAAAAQICQNVGYDEVNLNVGCPSERVQDGAFGACLMKEPHLVAAIMRELIASTNIPCTVKCRLGVDEFDTYEFAHEFIRVVSTEGNVKHFIVHARKAFLKGLNPSQNRSVPPLKYDFVYRLKQDFPHLQFTLNGGLKDHQMIQDALNHVDGVMLGRLAYENPWFFRNFDKVYYNAENPGFTRRQILLQYAEFVEDKRKRGCRMSTQLCVKPLINLFNGEELNKRYRQFLSNTDNHHKFGSFTGMIVELIKGMEEWNPSALDRHPEEEIIIQQQINVPA